MTLKLFNDFKFILLVVCNEIEEAQVHKFIA